MRRTIRWQIALPYLILLVIAMVVFTALAVGRSREQASIRWEEHLLSSAQVIADQAAPLFIPQVQTQSLSRLADSYLTNQGIAVAFLNPDATLIEIFNEGEPIQGEAPSQALITEALSQGTAAQVTTRGITALASIEGESNESTGVVHLFMPEGMYRPNLNWLWGLATVIIIISLLAGLILSMILRDQSRKPVEMLTIAAQQISMGNFRNLAFPETNNELNLLSQSLQEMAQHLAGQIDTLTTERAKLSAVLNQMTDGVLIIDSEGSVQLINPAAGRLFQIDESKANGRSLVEVLRYHQLVELWRKAKNGQSQSTMLEIGPQHMFLQAVATPLKTALPGNTMMLMQDLTQLRRLETVRRDFISNVSHELRTPLASLKALAETLQEGALEDPPAAQRFILRMETEIDNLTQLVNELLELSRIESGKVPLSFHRVQPCELLKPAYERMTLQAERAGLEMILDCQSELPPVFADPDRITQVMFNLIHNAVKFTPPGGKITISAYQDGNYIVFFVKDTGLGIPRKDLGRIFERFYKTDRARTSGGTGLGLSIAKHMVESHGGYIWAESEEGVGSTLNFSLPIA